MDLKDMYWYRIRIYTPFIPRRRVTKVSRRYGSVVATHLLKTPNLASMISSVILIDPVSILLHQPDVAYNFVIPVP